MVSVKALGRLGGDVQDEMQGYLSPGTLKFDPTLGGAFPEMAGYTATGGSGMAVPEDKRILPWAKKYDLYVGIGAVGALVLGIGAFFYYRER